VQSLYDRVAMQGHFAIDRKPEWWSQRLWTYPGDWVVYEGKRRGQIEGYLHYEVDSTDGPFDLAITLKEVVASTPEAHRGLVGYLASQRDQVKEIQYAAPGDHAWLGLLETAQNLRPGADMGLITDTGGLGAGAMLRVNDVKLALELLPVSPAARGEVVIEVEDAVLTQNSRAYRVTAREGRLKVSTGDGRTRTRRAARPPRLHVGAEALGPLVAGTLSPVRAAELGLIESSGGGAEAIESWFRARPVYLYGLNAF
jgi:predicted acetyltransferase